MSFIKNSKQHTIFQQHFVVAQAEESQDPSQPDPLINYGAEHLIDFGVVLIAVTLVSIVGMLSKQSKDVLLFALALSAFLIIVLWNI